MTTLAQVTDTESAELSLLPPRPALLYSAAGHLPGPQQLFPAPLESSPTPLAFTIDVGRLLGRFPATPLFLFSDLGQVSSLSVPHFFHL